MFRAIVITACLVLMAPLGVAAQSLSLSSYLGGSYTDAGLSVALDSAGNAYLAGSTRSPLMPCRGALTGEQNAFILKVNARLLVKGNFAAGLSPRRNRPDLESDEEADALWLLEYARQERICQN